jgi:hypothetical protein
LESGVVVLFHIIAWSMGLVRSVWGGGERDVEKCAIAVDLCVMPKSEISEFLPEYLRVLRIMAGLA